MAEAAAELRRIIALGASVTEVVAALGAGDRLVAVDVTSEYPPEVATLPKVGYFRAVAAEGLLSLTPDAVLADAQAGPPAALDAVAAAGVPVHRLQDGWTVEATAARIEQVGELLGRQAEATALAQQVVQGVAAARAGLPADTSRPRVMFLYARGARTQLMAGSNTAAHAMIELAGATNALSSLEGFRPITAEAVATADVDVILMPADSLQELGGIEGLGQLPGMSNNRAWQAGAVVGMDDALLLGFGPRLPEAVSTLISALEPWRSTAAAVVQ